MKCLYGSLLLIVCLSLLVCLSYQQIPSSCSGVPNMIPIVTAKPTLVNKTTHGELYIYNQVDPPLRHLKLRGTPYEMGYAAGQLLAPIIPILVQDTEDWLTNDLPSFLHTLPLYIQRLIIEVGMDIALESTIALTYPFTPPHFIQEIQGLADGSNFSFNRLYQLNVIPELIQAACSMYGIFPPARKNLLHLRALDWDTSSPFQKWPLVTSYQPSAMNSNNFSILAWPGFIGSLTGFSSAPMSIGEKVWAAYNGTQNRIGIPWHFLLRDILQFDQTISQAESRMANAERTCAIWVAVGEESNFNIVQYSFDRVEFYDWKAFPVWPAHPKVEGVMYLDRHEQPSGSKCMGELMEYWNGGGRKLDVEESVKYVTSGERTGDMHIAVMDYERMVMVVSNAGVYNRTTKSAEPAYRRTFVQVDMSFMRE